MHYNKKQNLSLLFVMGQLCAKLFIKYENCLRINAKNIEYADIKQVFIILNYFSLFLKNYSGY